MRAPPRSTFDGVFWLMLEKAAAHRELESFHSSLLVTMIRCQEKHRLLLRENSTHQWGLAKEPARVVLDFTGHRNFWEHELNRTPNYVIILGLLCQRFYELVLLKENSQCGGERSSNQKAQRLDRLSQRQK